jgi:hypothetical protein
VSPTHRTLTTAFNNQPAKVATVKRQLPRADNFPISFEGDEPISAEDIYAAAEARHQREKRMAQSLLIAAYFCLGLVLGLAALYRFLPA